MDIAATYADPVSWTDKAMDWTARCALRADYWRAFEIAMNERRAALARTPRRQSRMASLRGFAASLAATSFKSRNALVWDWPEDGWLDFAASAAEGRPVAYTPASYRRALRAAGVNVSEGGPLLPGRASRGQSTRSSTALLAALRHALDPLSATFAPENSIVGHARQTAYYSTSYAWDSTWTDAVDAVQQTFSPADLSPPEAVSGFGARADGEFSISSPGDYAFQLTSQWRRIAVCNPFGHAIALRCWAVKDGDAFDGMGSGLVEGLNTLATIPAGEVAVILPDWRPWPSATPAPTQTAPSWSRGFEVGCFIYDHAVQGGFSWQ